MGLVGSAVVTSGNQTLQTNQPQVLSQSKTPDKYWFLLHRKSNQEFLYQGVPGDINNSRLVRSFKVNTGIPNQKPTPLPQLLGREYWLVTSEIDSSESEETAPYFLTLDIPVTEEEPFGPQPYSECNGQCNWEIPGSFGLHGVADNPSKLSDEGSSGCIRHSNEDITYLYQLLDPQTQEIRYYIQDV